MILDSKDKQTFSRKFHLTALLILISLFMSFFPQTPSQASGLANVGDSVKIMGDMSFFARTGPSTQSSSIGSWFPGETFKVLEVVKGSYVSGYGRRY